MKIKINKFYYDYSKIDSYNLPLEVIVSTRGLGKTFGKLKYYTEKFVTKKKKFVYIVETDEMVKKLTQNMGEKFWKSILNYYRECNTSRKRYIYSKLGNVEVSEDVDELKDSFKENATITGGTIKIAGETAGYILDLNSFGEIKRNNFPDVWYILLDEFITEKMDKTVLENPRKISSIIQSVARLRNVKICFLGNAIRLDDPILSRLGIKLDRYGYYFIKDKYGVFGVVHYVDPNDYPEFKQEQDKSVAGRFAKLIGESNEENNEFVSDLPEKRRLKNFKYKKGGFSIHVVKENIVVTLRELVDGKIACVPFDGRNGVNLYCLNEREQGYMLGHLVICNKALRQTLTSMLRADVIYYYSEVEYSKLKFIIKGD